MKRQHSSDKLDIALDLTSLLDVIFIVLMVVMCQRELNVQAVNSEVSDLTAQLEDAESTIEMYEAYRDEVDGISDKVTFATLRVDFGEEDPSSRTVKLMIGEDVEGFTGFDITPDNEEEQYGLLQTSLEQFISSADGELPVWITLSDENILYRDWIRVTEMLESFKASYPNLYIDDRLVVQ